MHIYDYTAFLFTNPVLLFISLSSISSNAGMYFDLSRTFICPDAIDSQSASIGLEVTRPSILYERRSEPFLQIKTAFSPQLCQCTSEWFVLNPKLRRMCLHRTLCYAFAKEEITWSKITTTCRMGSQNIVSPIWTRTDKNQSQQQRSVLCMLNKQRKICYQYKYVCRSSQHHPSRFSKKHWPWYQYLWW